MIELEKKTTRQKYDITKNIPEKVSGFVGGNEWIMTALT